MRASQTSKYKSLMKEIKKELRGCENANKQPEIIKHWWEGGIIRPKGKFWKTMLRMA